MFHRHAMTNNRRTKEGDEVYTLLKLNPCSVEDRNRLDADAVIKAIRRSPRSAEAKYMFHPHVFVHCYSYPLHQAIRLRASTDVVEAIYDCYPQAIQETFLHRTALQLSIQYWAPIEVVVFLISKWPDAVRKKDKKGFTALHIACSCNAPYEVVSLLLNIWPGAAKEKSRFSRTPLHEALDSINLQSLDVITLLLEHHLYALKEKDDFNQMTPLHHTVRHKNAPLDLVLLLLEKSPETVLEKDRDGMTPSDTRKEVESKNEDIQRVLSYVSQLYSDTNLGNHDLKEIYNLFTELNWINGVLLILDRYPNLLKGLGIGCAIYPNLFSILGKRCTMKTMLNLVANELDIMEGA